MSQNVFEQIEHVLSCSSKNVSKVTKQLKKKEKNCIFLFIRSDVKSRICLYRSQILQSIPQREFLSFEC